MYRLGDIELCDGELLRDRGRREEAQFPTEMVRGLSSRGGPRAWPISVIQSQAPTNEQTAKDPSNESGKGEQRHQGLTGKYRQPVMGDLEVGPSKLGPPRRARLTAC